MFQFSSVTQSCLTLCDPGTAAFQASLSITNSGSSLRLTSIESVMPSSLLIFCHPLLLLPPIPPSIRVFSNESIFHIKWRKYSFQWIFRTDFLYDGQVGSPCSPKDSQESSPTPQIKNIIFLGSGFFTVQLSHPYMTTGKNIALTKWTFVGKVISLLFYMLSRLVITFLQRENFF